MERLQLSVVQRICAEQEILGQVSFAVETAGQRRVTCGCDQSVLHLEVSKFISCSMSPSEAVGARVLILLTRACADIVETRVC